MKYLFLSASLSNKNSYEIHLEIWHDDRNIVANILLIFNFKCFWHIFAILRRSRPEVFCKKGFLKFFSKFIGKKLCLSLFFDKVAGRLKKRLWHNSLPMSFGKFLRSSSLKNTSRQLFLYLSFKFIQAVFYTHSRNILSFSKKIYFSNNMAFVAVHAWLLNHEAKTWWWV